MLVGARSAPVRHRYSDDSEHLQALMVDLPPFSVPPCAASTACRLSIDKFALTFNVSDRREKRELLRMLHGFKHARRSRLYWRAHARRCGRLGGGTVHLYWGARYRNCRSCRIEFNPNRVFRDGATTQAGAVVVRALALAERDSIRVNRLDIAVDLPVALCDVQAVPDRVRCWQPYPESPDAAGVKAVYLGTPKSERQLVQYDKRWKRGGRKRTRYEMRLRPKRLLCLADLPDLPNCFADIRFCSLRPNGLPPSRRLKVQRARLCGLPSLLEELKRFKWERFVHAHLLTDTSVAVPHPRRVFDEQWRAVSTSLLRQLRYDVM